METDPAEVEAATSWEGDWHGIFMGLAMSDWTMGSNREKTGCRFAAL